MPHSNPSFLSREQVLASWHHCIWAHVVSPPLFEEWVRPSLRVRHLHAGQYLWRAGERPTAWVGVMRGAVKLCVPTEDGRSIALCGFAGSWFGEASLLHEGACFDCDAVALHDLTMLTLPAEAFQHLLRESPTFSRFLLGLMAERNLQFMRLNTAQQLPNITSRVARCLGALITPLNFPFPDAGQLNVTQSELADFCRVSRSRLNEALLALEREGLLELGYRSVRLKDVERLRVYPRP
ncbi:Crp/Fnr family transcriptional regulator [Comamonas humi]